MLPSDAQRLVAAGDAIQDWLAETLYDWGTGLHHDKVMGDGAIDTTLRTYNQGAVIAADVVRHRSTGEGSSLSRAEALARAALDFFSERFLVEHACVFHAIYFRGLLQLHSVTEDETLRSAITQAMQTHADDAWSNHRSPENLFSFPRSASDERLLDQGGMVQILATLAWNPVDYPTL